MEHFPWTRRLGANVRWRGSCPAMGRARRRGILACVTNHALRALGLLLVCSSGCFDPDTSESSTATESGTTTGSSGDVTTMTWESSSSGIAPTTEDPPACDADEACSSSSETGVSSGELDASSTSGNTSADTSESGASESSESGSDPTGDEACESPVPIDAVLIQGGSFTDAGTGPNVLHEIAAFRLDRTEVTVAAYEACVADGVCARPTTNADAPTCNYGAAERRQHPINCVSWVDATTFCAWTCGRLPTEWEWEWAARGRGAGRTYPWGTTPEPTCEYAVMNDPVEGVGCGLTQTAPVGSRSPTGDSLDGVRDLAGNVYEWTDSPYEDTTDEYVMRGGDWFFSTAPFLSVEERRSGVAESGALNTGFRCARPVQ